VTSNTERRHEFGTVGIPLPGVEIRLDEDGEILTKGPGNMLGYFGHPDATAETLDGGWIRTGDIGELDEAGFLRVTDRKKDLIKTAGGKYVAPQPIEARLQQSPLIEQAVLIGDERPYVVALIVPDWEALGRQAGVKGQPERLVDDEQAQAAVQQVVDEVNGGLNRWESVKYFRLLPQEFSEGSGEVTPTLKIKRRVVQQRYGEAIEAMYGPKKRPHQVGR
jgi:long-chain acyl-CoA synthetase